jgi:hypothetical protein
MESDDDFESFYAAAFTGSRASSSWSPAISRTPRT